MTRKEYLVIWLQAAGCTGCSVSVLNTAYPPMASILLEEVLPGKHLSLRFHPTLMAGAGKKALAALEEATTGEEKTCLLVVEGAIPTKKGYGAVGEVSLEEHLSSLGAKATAVVALGTCAAYGGIPAAAPNPSGCQGVRELLKKKGVPTPVINVPGCPPHPDWFVGTVAKVLLSGIPPEEELDDWGRPLLFYRNLIHENCPRRAAFNEGKFAKKPGEAGCLYELGCKGPITYSDCPSRLWNHGTNWCIGNGAPCHGCTQPEFPDLLGSFAAKLLDITLPTIGEYWKKEEER